MAKVSTGIRSLPFHSPTFHSLIVRRRPRMQINDNIEQSSYDSSRGDGWTLAANYNLPSSITKDMIRTKKRLCQRTACICVMWFIWLPCTRIDTKGEREREREREELGTYVTRVWCTCTCCGSCGTKFLAFAFGANRAFCYLSRQLIWRSRHKWVFFGLLGAMRGSERSCRNGFGWIIPLPLTAHTQKKKPYVGENSRLKKMLSLSATSVSRHVCISTPPQKPKA